MESPSSYCDCPNCCANRASERAYLEEHSAAMRAAGFVDLPSDVNAKPGQFLTIAEVSKSGLHTLKWCIANKFVGPERNYTRLPCMGWWADETRAAVE